MKIPKGMTEEEVHEVFMCVIGRIAPKYTCNGFDINDIKQESYIICISAMDRYQEGRPLENFLSVNLSNRLKNFLRDNNIYNTNEMKKQIFNPVSLSSCAPMVEQETNDMTDINELKDAIDEILPFDMRKDYLKMLSDIPVKPKRKEEIYSFIKSHFKDIDNEKG